MDSIIPQNFIKTVQDDFDTVFISKERPSTELNTRVRLAALRLITAVGMAIGSLYLLYTLPFYFSHPFGTILKVAFTVTCMAFERDLFVISKNATENLNVFVRAAGEVSNKFKDLKDKIFGNKEKGEAPSHPITENTIFRTYWDRMNIGEIFDKRVLLPILEKQAGNLAK